MRVFKIEYSGDDELLNLSNDPVERLREVLKLREEGYTHVSDFYWGVLTGECRFWLGEE